MAAKSTWTVESQRHQRALQTAARTFLNVMKSDNHSQEKYIVFLKDVKGLIHDHVNELKTCNVTEIMKTMLENGMCSSLQVSLHPSESTTDSSDDDFPGHIPNAEEDDIFHEFPPGTLTDEVWQTISSCFEHMEQSHTEAAMAAIQSTKKLAHMMPLGPFRLLLQSMIHLIISIKGWWYQCVEHREPSPKKPAFSDIVPDNEKAHVTYPYWSVSWLQLWHTPWRLSLASKCQSLVKVVSYQVPEKKFWTCVKCVKYDSGAQKVRQSGMITPKLFKCSRKQDKESNSEIKCSRSEEEEGDEEDIFAKVQPLQRKWKHGKRQWKK